jgi:hypothetical protein
MHARYLSIVLTTTRPTEKVRLVSSLVDRNRMELPACLAPVSTTGLPCGTQISPARLRAADEDDQGPPGRQTRCRNRAEGID